MSVTLTHIVNNNKNDLDTRICLSVCAAFVMHRNQIDENDFETKETNNEWERQSESEREMNENNLNAKNALAMSANFYHRMRATHYAHVIRVNIHGRARTRARISRPII